MGAAQGQLPAGRPAGPGARLWAPDGASHVDAVLALDALRTCLLRRDVLAVLQQRLRTGAPSAWATCCPRVLPSLTCARCWARALSCRAAGTLALSWLRQAVAAAGTMMMGGFSFVFWNSRSALQAAQRLSCRASRLGCAAGTNKGCQSRAVCPQAAGRATPSRGAQLALLGSRARRLARYAVRGPSVWPLPLCQVPASAGVQLVHPAVSRAGRAAHLLASGPSEGRFAPAPGCTPRHASGLPARAATARRAAGRTPIAHDRSKRPVASRTCRSARLPHRQARLAHLARRLLLPLGSHALLSCVDELEQGPEVGARRLHLAVAVPQLALVAQQHGQLAGGRLCLGHCRPGAGLGERQRAAPCSLLLARHVLRRAGTRSSLARSWQDRAAWVGGALSCAAPSGCSRPAASAASACSAGHTLVRAPSAAGGRQVRSARAHWGHVQLRDGLLNRRVRVNLAREKLDEVLQRHAYSAGQHGCACAGAGRLRGHASRWSNSTRSTLCWRVALRYSMGCLSVGCSRTHSSVSRV